MAATVELDIDLQRRVERVAEAQHVPASSVMRRAVEEYVARMERRHQLGLRDTSSPEFKADYRRQMAVVSERYRKTNFADHWEPTEEDLKGWV